MWIQIYGAFQGLIALLILGGDCLGGVLLFLSLIVSGLLKYCQICNFLQWEVSRQLEVNIYPLLVCSIPYNGWSFTYFNLFKFKIM